MNTLEFAQRGSTLDRPLSRIKLTPQQREEVALAYIAGKSSGVLARKYRVGRGYVRHLAEQRGYMRREARRA
jgi:hypothetical protein